MKNRTRASGVRDQRQNHQATEALALIKLQNVSITIHLDLSGQYEICDFTSKKHIFDN